MLALEFQNQTNIFIWNLVEVIETYVYLVCLKDHCSISNINGKKKKLTLKKNLITNKKVVCAINILLILIVVPIKNIIICYSHLSVVCLKPQYRQFYYCEYYYGFSERT